MQINPNRNLENQWRTDRSRLVVCKNRHTNLVKWQHGVNDHVSGGR